MEKSSTGLAVNVAGLLCYVLFLISGLVFALIERESKFVRFHAIQSVYVFSVLTIVYIIFLGLTPIIGSVPVWLIRVLWIILWIILMIKASQGKMYKLPWAGDIAARRVG